MTDQAMGFECIALVPCDPGTPGMALAAARAGGTGVLDLEFAGNVPGTAARLLHRARWIADRARPGDRVGVRLSPPQLPKLLPCVTALPGGALVLLCAPPAPETTRDLVERGYRVLVEVRSLEQYQEVLASGAQVEGVIACGNEAGGGVGEDTTFILVQKLLRQAALPVYARGGIGIHAAAGCRAAGAAGVVLDDQLLLLEESPLPESWQRHLLGLSGQETVVVGQDAGRACRVLDRPLFAGTTALKQLSAGNSLDAHSWDEAVRARVAWRAPEEAAWPVGQGIGLANVFRKRYGTVGKVIQAVLAHSARAIELACAEQPLAPGAALARSHGTEYPFVQGPMTRVSDRPAFSRAVAEAGALPLLALAMLRGPQARPILEEARERLGDRPWGVGILGFVSRELQAEQLAEVLRVRPPFALIAGGRPDQAAALEREGISTYLHVPVAGLLRHFLAQGARRFVFEGRECGGHVGPLCSFPLWEAMIETLLEAAPADEENPVHVLFAGGIHDGGSAAILSAMAAPLAQRGIRCGVLMGTAYLFTEEAVETGAILKRYQDEAVRCRTTVLLTTGVGHSNRVADTAFAEEFERRRHELKREARPADEAREALEQLTLGRLRLASKGVTRNEQGELVQATEAEQAGSGLYMLGQAATLRSSVCRMADLHREISEGARERLEAARGRLAAAAEEPDGIAIIGIGALLPGAREADRFWRNVLDRVSAIREVPRDRWDIDRTFDAEKSTRDRAYSRWGGFIDEIPFDPVRYRIPPTTIRTTATCQLLALEVTRWALADAGYAQRPFDRNDTAVILGMAGPGSYLGEQLIARTILPHALRQEPDEALDTLPGWTGDTFPGVLQNVTAGRIANQLDLGGPNYAVDAACAASLVAIDLAVRELESGRSSMAIAGGVDTTQTPFSYVAFSKTQALSPTGQARVFDKTADGIVISEAVCCLVLKRLSDARRDGDRVYAVIRGSGGSSDGKGLGLTAPKVDGQRRAIERALRHAGFTADTLGLYEAHGTGTPLGDRTELETLAGVLREAGAAPGSCAVGSAKSLVGHAKTAAGVIGVIKAALALHHRVLPPHEGARDPLEPLVDPATPVYLLERPRPWLARPDTPRRAAVSAFGFGGTNSHLVLEEAGEEAPLGAEAWPCELFLFRARTAEELALCLHTVAGPLRRGASPRLGELAYACAREFEGAAPGPAMGIVAADAGELLTALEAAERWISGSQNPEALPPNVTFSAESRAPEGKVAFLFPGQGAQHPNMAWEPAVYLPEVRHALELADTVLQPRFGARLSDTIFPPAAFTPQEEMRQRGELTATHRAQPAIGTLSLGFLDLLERLGLSPDLVAGHSYGELVALHAAGILSRRSLLELSEARGRAMAGCPGGSMAGVHGPREQVEALLGADSDVVIANHNAPAQTVISGPAAAIEAACVRLTEAGFRTTPLPVSGAFHSPLMESALSPWSEALSTAEFAPSRLPAYANLDGGLYPDDADQVRERLRRQMVQPVEFVTQVRRMHADGARLFVEVGPGTILGRLTGAILEGTPHQVVSLDPQRGSLRGLLSSLASLATGGVLPQPSRLFMGRELGIDSVEGLLKASLPQPPSPTCWMINGTTAHPPAGTPAEPARSRTPAPRPANGSVPAIAAAPPSAASVPAPAAAVHRAAAQTGAVVHAPPLPAVPSTFSPAASVGLNRADVLAAYSAYQETMRRFLALEEQALAGFFALAQGNNVPAPYPPPPAPVPYRNGAANGYPNGSHYDTNGAPHPAPPVPAGVPSPVAVAPVPPEGAAPQNTLEDLDELVLRALSEQTGYPRETLGLDLDLVGELGVDSIRRVEFLNTVSEGLPPAVRAAATGSMEKLLAAPTLRALLDLLRSFWSPDGSGVNGKPPSLNGAGMPSANGNHAASRDDVTRMLLTVVSESTGYPLETLGLEHQIEGELGIDSLRRTEIIETLVSRLPGNGTATRTADVGALLQAKTLGQIIGLLCPNGHAAKESLTAAPVVTPAARQSRDCPRAVPRGVPASLTAEEERALAGSVLLVEDDLGVSPLITERLQRLEVDVRAITRETAADPDALGRELESLPGSISAVLHLGALARTAMPGEFATWRKEVQIQCKSLFQVLQLAAPQLRKSASRVLAASLLGGQYGREISLGPGLPIGGGSAGLLKSLALEWPGTSVKTVDFDGAETPARMAELLVSELLHVGPNAEIGYPGGVRTAFQCVSAPLPEPSRKALEIGKDWVVLATGGGRGITADLLQTLARPGIRMVVVGQSPAPEPESPDLVGLEDAAALRAHFLARAAAEGKPVLPARMEAAVQQVLRNRERRSALARLAASGAEVTYRPCDVRDPAAVQALLDWVYATYGRVDALLHGAGVIEDRLLVDKSRDSFDRVFDTKVDSIYLLSRCLRPEDLKLAVLFGSVSGRQGNPGQTDYAAANEVLNRFGWWLKARWPGARVVTINWGPWASSGMATPAVQARLEERGIFAISTAAGCAFFTNEVTADQDDAEVLAGEGPWCVPAAQREEVGAWK